ncbi:MAG TPA: ACT domain-containing protein [Actinomycetes bacterium]|jgi:ribosomal protein S18 acetylase RimI-like enzyme|nr:ACT domain-containing protein [Actinomycetes bacterium]
MSGETDLEVLLRSMRPVLDPGEYVYALVDQPPPELLPFAVVREDEGTTILLPRTEADRRGLGYVAVSRRITLEVHSSLQAVGLTAAVSTALAGRGIGCNVIAGVHHDHLFVPNDRAEEALEILRELSERPDSAGAAQRRVNIGVVDVPAQAIQAAEDGSGAAAQPVRVRPATVRDTPALVGLWQAVGLEVRPHEVAAELASVLRRDPDIVLVAEDEHGLAASVFGAHDGRRGWVNRLATRPDRRRQGLARQLMALLEQALSSKGCRKVNLLIEPDNDSVVSFYRAVGYQRDELIFMEKHLQGR